MLTGNKLTLKIAWHNLIKQNGQVPLATSLHWITNRFWFTLNKGFGNNELPKSFDATIKAQLILSSTLSDMVHSNYKDLSEQFKSKKLTKEQAAGRLIELKQQALKPEEINKTNIDSIAVTLSNKEILDEKLCRLNYMEDNLQTIKKKLIRLSYW